MKILEAVKIGALCSLMFFLICLGIATLRVSSDINRLTTSAQQTLVHINQVTDQAQNSLVSIQKDVNNIQVMTNATLFQAEEVLRHTDVYIATAQKAQEHQLKQLDSLMEQMQITVKNVDESQKAIATSAMVALNDLPLVTKQLTETMKSLQLTIDQTRPILKATNDILVHWDGISADAQTEVHNIVYPQPKPWYTKTWGVLKLGLRMLTFSVN